MPHPNRYPAQHVAAILVLILGAFSSTTANAQNAQRGKELYFTLPGTSGSPPSCAGCHSSPPDRVSRRGANNAGLIASAVGQNKGNMGYVGQYMNNTDYADLAAYLANPEIINSNPGGNAGSTTTTGTVGGVSTGVQGSAPAAEPSNVGGGGCSTVSSQHGRVDPLLWLLAGLAAAVLGCRIWLSQRRKQVLSRAEKKD
jgi:cytochrome c553